MNRLKIAAPILSFAIMAGIHPAVAQVSALQPQTSVATADSIAQNVFAQLKAGHARQAINGFFGSNSLASGKETELQLLSSQIDSTIAAYGPISNCELVERVDRGTLVASHLYLCQHSKYVTRWILLLAKTSSGWSGATITFDDKISLPLGS